MLNAESYVGLPWGAGGSDRDGVDCWGLLRLVYRETYGIDLPAYTIGEQIDISEAVTGGGWRQVEEPKTGDCALFRRLGGNLHVGIVIPQGLLHIEDGQQSVVIRGAPRASKLIGYFRQCRTS